MKIIFASNNDHKIREIRAILDSSISLLSLRDINIAEDIPEEEPDLEGNALAKARYIHNIAGMNVFADDTGLEVDALGGLPGVKSARFAGDTKDFSANIDKLIKMLGSKTNRSARFRTVIALIWNNQEYLFEGVVEGRIIDERRGTKGFGYDPVFIPEGRTKTFAEMTLTEKNMISHRARALEKLRKFMPELTQTGNKQP
ncbi:MAG TPA: RdgB/HAM1 family non-canonical purine NTP pyrophosphatase [Bacteroidales bacterium]|nr:RdgB/HAM1 family non-canonical purine NTP pyrophosphatase [Bacteroidales bacterium]